MAARAAVGADGDDCADRVHGLFAAAFAKYTDAAVPPWSGIGSMSGVTQPASSIRHGSIDRDDRRGVVPPARTNGDGR
jgi:hypothetical protein